MFMNEQTDWIPRSYPSGADRPDGRVWRLRGRCVRLHDLYLHHTDFDRRLGMSNTEAGVIATGSLLSSAVGGWAAGVLADRYGRVRIYKLQ